MNKDQFKQVLKLRDEIQRATYSISREAIHHRFDPEWAVELRGSAEALIELAESLASETK